MKDVKRDAYSLRGLEKDRWGISRHGYNAIPQKSQFLTVPGERELLGNCLATKSIDVARNYHLLTVFFAVDFT